jgi:hypothetical protein
MDPSWQEIADPSAQKPYPSHQMSSVAAKPQLAKNHLVLEFFRALSLEFSKCFAIHN